MDVSGAADWREERRLGSRGGCEVIDWSSILRLDIVEKDLVPPVEVLGWEFAAPWPDLT